MQRRGRGGGGREWRGVVGVDAEEVVEKVEAGRRGGVVVDEVEVKERVKEEGSRGRNTLAQLTKKITRYN